VLLGGTFLIYLSLTILIASPTFFPHPLTRRASLPGSGSARSRTTASCFALRAAIFLARIARSTICPLNQTRESCCAGKAELTSKDHWRSSGSLFMVLIMSRRPSQSYIQHPIGWLLACDMSCRRTLSRSSPSLNRIVLAGLLLWVGITALTSRLASEGPGGCL